jgi:hypothetical protein
MSGGGQVVGAGVILGGSEHSGDRHGVRTFLVHHNISYISCIGIGGWLDGWMAGWLDGWVGGWVGGWAGGWVSAGWALQKTCEALWPQRPSLLTQEGDQHCDCHSTTSIHRPPLWGPLGCEGFLCIPFHVFLFPVALFHVFYFLSSPWVCNCQFISLVFVLALLKSAIGDIGFLSSGPTKWGLTPTDCVLSAWAPPGVVYKNVILSHQGRKVTHFRFLTQINLINRKHQFSIFRYMSQLIITFYTFSQFQQFTNLSTF